MFASEEKNGKARRHKVSKKKGRISPAPLAVSFQSYCTLTCVMRVAQLPNAPRVLLHVKLVAT